jgi:hypothetical protein
MEVTASPLATGMIVLAAVLALSVWLGMVLLAARRPYFRHPHPESIPGKVRGGMHLGDPRSLAPPEWERADLPQPRAPGRPLPRRRPAGRPSPGQRAG